MDTEQRARRSGGPSRGATFADSSTSTAWRYRLFARMWAVAALFHLAGNAREALTTSVGLTVASTALSVGAALTLLTPHWRRGLLLLCASIPLTAWYEAPVVGNHWVLASAISLALLLSHVPRRASSRPSLEAFWPVFSATARASLLIAYGFAAFAKINSDFFDPAVSCAVYYHNQLVGSWGLHLLQVTPGDPAGRALAVAAAVTEVAVALGLALPRTRRAALALATSFHWLLAMDLGQHFWDFSAVLFAGFLLFLDDGQVTRLREWSQRLSDRQVRQIPGRSAVIALTAVVAALAILPVPTALDVLLVLLGHLAWWGYGTMVVLACAALLGAPRSSSTDARKTRRLVYTVPVLVLLNGLTPYLEVKTGFGWNMYSNLRTVAGDTNHLLLPATVDVTGLQADQVRILSSSDAVLRRLRDDEYALTYSEFREYAQAHPDVAVTYLRNGRVVRASRLADDAAGTSTPSALSHRLQSFRVVDLSGAERCQPSFSPAR